MDLFCSLASRKIKSMSELTGAYIHNETVKGRSQAPNINQNGTFYSLLDNHMSYADKWYERIADVEVQSKRKIKPRKDAVYALEWVAGMPKEAIGVVDIEEWTRLTKEWLFKQVGKENVIGFAVHLDENSPHIHMTFVPINKNLRLNQKEFVGGSGKLHWLQSDYAKAVESVGLKRGVINSKTKHESIQRLYTTLNKTLDEKLPDKLPEETIEEYKNRLDDIYTESRLQALKLKTDIGREIKSHVAFTQRYHRGIKFQDKMKSIFGDNTDEVFSTIENMSNNELMNMIDTYTQMLKKKQSETEAYELEHKNNENFTENKENHGER